MKLSLVRSTLRAMPLDPTDRRILEIENQYWRYAGRKLAAIRELGLTEGAFGRRLVELVSDPHAAAEFPLLVTRLKRRLDAGRAARQPRRVS